MSELSAELRDTLERRFASVWVEGEVGNFVQAGSGHWYFNLNDGSAQIRCACFRGTNFRIRFKPANGLLVRLRGRVTVYEPRGELQLTIDSLEPSGEGALAAAFEQIRSKLETEGLFAGDLKRPIPFFPRRVAVLTSRSGAAFHDIYNVLTRRARSVGILLVPVIVQGEGAADSIRRALVAVNRYNAELAVTDRIDVLIVGRGGGSAEDLWAYNDEQLARAIRSSEIPVVSAVGHEIDWTIADMVADVRAATPSAAAEMVAGREEDILRGLTAVESDIAGCIEDMLMNSGRRLDEMQQRVLNAFLASVSTARSKFDQIERRLSPARLEATTLRLRSVLEGLDRRQRRVIDEELGTKRESFGLLSARLDALSPLAVLGRGYSIVQDENGRVLRDAAAAAAGETLKITFQRGKLEAEVLSVE